MWFRVISCDFLWIFFIVSRNILWFRVFAYGVMQIHCDFIWLLMVSCDFMWFPVISHNFMWFRVWSFVISCDFTCDFMLFHPNFKKVALYYTSFTPISDRFHTDTLTGAEMVSWVANPCTECFRKPWEYTSVIVVCVYSYWFIWDQVLKPVKLLHEYHVSFLRMMHVWSFLSPNHVLLPTSLITNGPKLIIAYITPTIDESILIVLFVERYF